MKIAPTKKSRQLETNRFHKQRANNKQAVADLDANGTVEVRCMAVAEYVSEQRPNATMTSTGDYNYRFTNA